MCGITALFDLSAVRRVDESRLRAMTNAISHRGPDGEGYFVQAGIGLGHRRLAIIDLEGGHQPLFNEDGSVAVIFNGEIYNFHELATQLELLGHRFRTRSDTEVIVHAWEQWGEACVNRFDGMFAFVAWDSTKRVLFAARDRLGKKPFYYSTTSDGWLCIASELKALLRHPQIPRALEPEAIEDYFAYGYVPDPRTILSGVRKLPPGHTLIAVTGKSPRISQYWDLVAVDQRPSSEAQVAEELVHRLRKAVRKRLISDVPLGAFLSGGVDSSGVVAMMAGLSTEPVRTCSIKFKSPQFDESKYAKQIAERYSTDHRMDSVDVDDLELVDKLAEVYDEPFADSSAIPTYRVCQLARKYVTVALSGDGGDEVFGGYRRYSWHLHEERVRSLIPGIVRRPLFGYLGSMYPKLQWAPRYVRAKSTFEALARDSLEGYFHSVAILPDTLRWRLFSSDFASTLGNYRAIEVLRTHAAHAPYRDALSLVQYLDLKTYLPGDILVKVDRAAMAHSLEVRVPMLDYTLVEWVTGLEAALKIRRGIGKYILKKCLEPYVPSEILYRKKMGFAVPIADWLRGPIAGRMQDALGTRALRECGLFDIVAIRRMMQEHIKGSWDHSAALWGLMMFESCMRLTEQEGTRRN